MFGTLTREVFRREAIPAIGRWTLVALSMQTWLRGLARGLRPALGDEAGATVQELFAEVLKRRGEVLLRANVIRTPADVVPFFRALYQIDLSPRAAWLFGPRVSRRARLRGYRLASRMTSTERWVEVATHAGELLVVATERLPDRFPRAVATLGDIFFEMGRAEARSFQQKHPDATGARGAVELLRMGEYVFHVNPSHETGFDTGDPKAQNYLVGDACLWHPRPGWDRLHCGVFGRFQAGVCQEFGLNYKLDKTIPKHGGDSCRVVFSPLRKSRTGDRVG